MEIAVNKRDAAFAELKQFDPAAKNSDFMEVTAWTNMEGYDVVINSTGLGQRQFAISWGEMKALKKLVKHLDKLPLDA